MEAVGSRLGRASSRYGGAPAVFSGPVRKWKKKWVRVSSSLHTTKNHSNSHSHSSINNSSNNSASSRLLLRRWTPITAASAAEDDDPSNVSDEPPRRKFRYTPIAVLEEQKKVLIETAEHEPAAESDQLPARETNVTHEVQEKLDMNEISEEGKDSNIDQLEHGSDYQGSVTEENAQNSDDQLETNIQ